MKTASVRDLRQDFARVLAWVQSGEEVAITMRRQAVARLVPYSRRRKPNVPMPDVAARLEKLFGSKTIPDGAMKALWDQDRSTR